MSWRPLLERLVLAIAAAGLGLALVYLAQLLAPAGP
jgi:hypothetical protein